MRDVYGKEITFGKGLTVGPIEELWSKVRDRAHEVVGLVRHCPGKAVASVYNVSYYADGVEQKGLPYNFTCRSVLAPWRCHYTLLPAHSDTGRRIFVLTEDIHDGGLVEKYGVFRFGQGRAEKIDGNWKVTDADHVLVSMGDLWCEHPCFVAA